LEKKQEKSNILSRRVDYQPLYCDKMVTQQHTTLLKAKNFHLCAMLVILIDTSLRDRIQEWIVIDPLAQNIINYLISPTDDDTTNHFDYY
ncbi:9834_t:CDS:1, partial [Racocetra fulgida]